jgi:hypothetical protein
MKFSPKPGRVYNLTDSINFLETAYMFNKNIQFEGRLSDGTLVTYQYVTSDNTFSMLFGSGRCYSYRKTHNSESFIDIIIVFVRNYEFDENNTSSTETTETTTANEWWF